jgi:hypothetical protein
MILPRLTAVVTRLLVNTLASSFSYAPYYKYSLMYWSGVIPICFLNSLVKEL